MRRLTILFFILTITCFAVTKTPSNNITHKESLTQNPSSGRDVQMALIVGNHPWIKYYKETSKQHKRQAKKSLGDPCFIDRDCGTGREHVCKRGTCDCRPQFIRHNSTHCLPGVLLGFRCVSHSQCIRRVPGSTCVQQFCRCEAGKVPYRRANCLDGASLGQSCRTDSQCSLGNPGSACKWTVRNVMGKCHCKPGMPRRGNSCGPPGFALGAPCGISYDCAQHVPGSICAGSEESKTKSTFDKGLGRRGNSKAIGHTKDIKYDKRFNAIGDDSSLGGVCTCPEGYIAVKNGSKCVSLQKDIGVTPVSLGKPCLFSSQCKASDPYSHCNAGVCDCLRTTSDCSANHTGCFKGTFQCVSDGRCVSAEFVCDGKRQCQDGSDEKECDKGSCSPLAFTCRDGSCVARGRVCDGQVDCPDASDEDKCKANDGDCPATSFRCRDGQCLPGFTFCNAIISCKDKSDETEAACVGGLFRVPFCPFRCKNGRCRSRAILCSGVNGCGDLSDEENCSVCNCPKPF